MPDAPKTTEPLSDSKSGMRKVPLAIAGIMLALLLWGLYLAIGTAIYHREGEAVIFDPLRFGIVIAASLIFLGGWLLLLARWRPRPRRTDLPLQPPEDDPPMKPPSK